VFSLTNHHQLEKKLSKNIDAFKTALQKVKLAIQASSFGRKLIHLVHGFSNLIIVPLLFSLPLCLVTRDFHPQCNNGEYSFYSDHFLPKGY